MFYTLVHTDKVNRGWKKNEEEEDGEGREDMSVDHLIVGSPDWFLPHSQKFYHYSRSQKMDTNQA